VVVDVAASRSSREAADIALFDPFATTLDVAAVLGNSHASKVVIYSWQLDAGLVDSSLAGGASGVLSKCLPAPDLVRALERIQAGEIVVSGTDGMTISKVGSDWHGRQEGLSLRESEIIALIAQGLSNQEIADRAYLSINTVKSYIRSSYRKMGVTTRSRAVLWGVEHGFRPDQVRLRPFEDDVATPGRMLAR
ncbi:MAG: response regulator transcription factor, partial [Marmoricola sp.]